MMDGDKHTTKPTYGYLCLTEMRQQYRRCGAQCCKTSSVLLCVLGHPRVDDSSAGTLKRGRNWSNWLKPGPATANVTAKQYP